MSAQFFGRSGKVLYGAFSIVGMAYQSQNVNNGIPDDRVARSSPTGKVCFVYFSFTFENVDKFHGLASKLVLENMLSHARTMFYWVLNEILSNIQVFKGK